MLRLNSLGEVFKAVNTSPDVAQDVSHRVERAKLYTNHGDPTVSAFRRRKVYLRKKSRRRVEIVKRQTSEVLRSDKINNTLYTLVNGVTGHVDGRISLETLPSSIRLFELDKFV